MKTQEDVSSLVEEYRSLIGNVSSKSWKSIKEALVREGEWSSNAADLLIQLSKHHGSFVLRNALALAVALNVEDGDLGM